jgi:hypothetical protein
MQLGRSAARPVREPVPLQDGTQSVQEVRPHAERGNEEARSSPANTAAHPPCANPNLTPARLSIATNTARPGTMTPGDLQLTPPPR